jgi:hypothetical protein
MKTGISGFAKFYIDPFEFVFIDFRSFFVFHKCKNGTEQYEYFSDCFRFFSFLVGISHFYPHIICRFR